MAITIEYLSYIVNLKKKAKEDVEYCNTYWELTKQLGDICVYVYVLVE